MELYPQQQQALKAINEFIKSKDARVFILKGYAGTGKTTLMRSLVKELSDRQEHFKLLASTGRAAKILANATGCPAATIHSEIYKFTDLNQDLEKVASKRESTSVDSTGQLFLNFELTPIDRSDESPIMHYIIDEASMVSDIAEKNAAQAIFGSGKLLTDLFKYDPTGKFIFVGDTCQLPPVTQSISPALSKSYIEEHFGYRCMECELTQVLRQAADVDIVHSAHKLRKLFHSPQPWKWAKFPLRGYKDIHVLNSQASLLGEYIKRVNELGYNDATMLCFSNKQCDITTQLLRPSFGHHSPQLETGDLLLVTQNNLISGLMNGDLAVVESVEIKERRAGLTFLNVSVKELFTRRVYKQLMIAEVLYGNQTNLTQPQQRELLIDFYYRMRDNGIRQGSEAFNTSMIRDPYLNALRAVFGYALTCHKAQGGEWDYVYLDIPKHVPALAKPYVYQWVYTAMTRARKGLYIVDDFWVM